MRNACLTGLLAVAAACVSCSGKEPQVGAVVATAGALQAVQLARAQNPANQPTSGECCTLCGPCEFPCGDYCVPFGTLCPEPTGCACTTLPKGTTGDLQPDDGQARPDCDHRSMLPVPGAD